VTRVWLTDWEWGCCGDPFAVGDEVDFGIETRTPGSEFADAVGHELAATIDALESHHEEEFPDRVRGRVTSVFAVTHEVVERRHLRRPGRGAPADAIMPADGEEWPMVGRDLGNGVSFGSRPSRYVIEAVPVAGSATLTPVRGIRLADDRDENTTPDVDTFDDPPVERRARSLMGWLVEVDEA
jgi:hypothetical protein